MYLLRSRPPLDNPFLMECFFAVGRFSQESAAFCRGGGRGDSVLGWGSEWRYVPRQFLGLLVAEQGVEGM